MKGPAGEGAVETDAEVLAGSLVLLVPADNIQAHTSPDTAHCTTGKKRH